jgi:hypothetical protein
MLWRILSEAVMVLHLLLICFLIVSAVLLATGFFKERRNWQFFYYAVVALALGVVMNNSVKILKYCPLTALEYMLRRQYDPSESWVRTRSLMATVVFNTTGVEVPEYIFTIALVSGIVVMISSLILWRAKGLGSS